jgi:acylphosphatase
MVVATCSRRYLISGRVQGVAYRAAARARARELGISGWARNLPDGRVEVLACGPPALLAEFERWLAQGPALAAVVDVESAPSDLVAGPGFAVR